MKKISLFISAAVVSLFAFVSCNDRIEEQTPFEGKMHQVLFETSELSTKTAIESDGNVNKMTWENTPSSYVHLFENGDEGRSPQITVSKDKRTATFSANFWFMNLDLAPTYNAIIAANYSNGVASIPDVQYPKASSFDPAADILISDPVRKLSFDSSVKLSFSRVVAVSRLKFTNLKPGEKIELIEIACTNNIAGSLNKLKDYKFNGYADGGSNKITLKFSSDNVVAMDGTFETYFISEAVAPGSLKVTVATDKSVYTKSASSSAMLTFTFDFDKLKDISINMDGCRSDRKAQKLVYKDEALNWALAEGKYTIGGTYSGQSFTEASDYQPELLSYTSSNTSVATVDNTGRVTIRKEGTVTITATAASSINYLGTTASYDINIYTPYYQRISSKSELTSGDKYLIVSRTDLLVNWYHAFNASVEGTYNFDINKSLFSSQVYDNGKKIKASAQIDANQVEIENGLLSDVMEWFGFDGTYTVKPVANGKYLYCNMGIESLLDTKIPLVAYSISFANLSASDFANPLGLINKIATIPHNIVFNEDGTVTIRSASSRTLKLIGADLYYDKLSNKYQYVNMSMFDGIDDISELYVKYGKTTEYAWLFNLIESLGGDATIKDIVDYFSADMYLYKYID